MGGVRHVGVSPRQRAEREGRHAAERSVTTSNVVGENVKLYVGSKAALVDGVEIAGGSLTAFARSYTFGDREHATLRMPECVVMRDVQEVTADEPRRRLPRG